MACTGSLADQGILLYCPCRYNQILMGNTLEQLPMITPTAAPPMLLSPRVVKDTIDQSYWTEQGELPVAKLDTFALGRTGWM